MIIKLKKIIYLKMLDWIFHTFLLLEIYLEFYTTSTSEY